jgi:hypothetical protein
VRDPREAKIENLQLPFAGDNQVLRLDVAMDHPLFVGGGQAECGMAHQITSLQRRERAALGDKPVKAHPVDIFHHQKVQIAGLFGVVGGDDMRMHEAGGGAHFAAKTLDGLRVLREFAVNHLQRDGPGHQQVLSPKDGAHSTVAKHAEHAIAGVVLQFVGDWCWIVIGAFVGNRNRGGGPGELHKGVVRRLSQQLCALRTVGQMSFHRFRSRSRQFAQHIGVQVLSARMGEKSRHERLN